MNESRIGELRKARGWTQERLASRSGVAVRTVQRSEAGKDAGLETLPLIGNALGVPVRDLFISVEDEDFQTNNHHVKCQAGRDPAEFGRIRVEVVDTF